MKFVAIFNTLFTFRMFEQLLIALKNRVCSEFTVLNVLFIIQNFEQLALALKTEFALKIFTALNIVLHSGFLSNLCLP